MKEAFLTHKNLRSDSKVKLGPELELARRLGVDDAAKVVGPQNRRGCREIRPVENVVPQRLCRSRPAYAGCEQGRRETAIAGERYRN